MKHELSFAKVNLLCDRIVELTINEGVKVSMEMLDEYEQFHNKHVGNDFALLINRVNNYHYAFEAKFSVASQADLCAIAIITYNDHDINEVNELKAVRAIDELNIKVFSGLEFGWQAGYSWLQEEVNSVEACCCG